MGETIELPLDAITLDVDLQPRAKMDKRLVEDYVYAIADGATMPPVTVVRNGEKNWLADGYHRFHAHDTLRLPAIRADVREGNTLDAVMISLRANAEHGSRRRAGDYRKAYDIARHFNLVPAADSHAVATFLRCSMRWAEMLTKEARQKKRRAEAAVVDRGKAEGKSEREIADETGIARSTVQRRGGPKTHNAEMGRAAGHRWHQALMALRKINEQAEVSALFDARYTRFDHVFGPELERAHAWITELHRRYFDG